MTVLQIIGWSVAGTVLFELLTCLFRFLLGLRASRDTASVIAPWTRGIRVHHGYPGIVMLVVAAMGIPSSPFWRSLLIIVGVTLVASDLVHHFLVLWLATGRHEFDLVYPPIAERSAQKETEDIDASARRNS